MILVLDAYKQAGESWEAALTACLKDVPVADYTGRDNTRRAVGAEILLMGNVEPYRFSSFEMPTDKLISLRAATTHGAIVASERQEPAFIIKSGWSNKVFEGLMFDTCGVKFEPQARGSFIFDRCAFDRSPDWGIQAGEGVVGGSVYDCRFVRCNGAVGLLGKAADNWLIDEQTLVIRSSGTNPAVRTNSSGLTVRCKFENRESLGVKAYLQVAPSPGFAGGQVTIDGCRFGGELGTGLGQPPACVLLGGDTEETGTMSGVRITNCDFNRVQGQVESAYDAISCNKAVNLSQFFGNRFLGGYRSVVRYNNAESKFTISNIRDNDWSCNVIDSASHMLPVYADITAGLYQRLSMWRPFSVAN